MRDRLQVAYTEEYRAGGAKTKFSSDLGHANIASLFSEAKDSKGRVGAE